MEVAMRDIRKDLIERLGNIDREEADLQSRLKSLATMREGIKALIQADAERFAPQPLFATEDEATIRPALTATVINALRMKPEASLDEIREIVERTGYDFGDRKPGRSVHFALVGLKNSGIVENLGNSRWRILPEERNGHEEERPQ
jgi:hypothetical protein